MKNSTLMISVVFAFLCLLTPALSQTVPFRVTAPFDFTVGNQKLPAGEYRITVVNDSSLRVVSMDGSKMANAVTTHISGGSNQDPTSRLVFHRYDDRRFLSQVCLGEVRHELFISGLESEYARIAKQESVTVAAK